MTNFLNQKSHECRMKCGSVMFALESSLGDFTKKMAYEQPHEINNEELMDRAGGTDSVKSWDEVIEHSYFAEILDLACRAAEDTTYEKPMYNLRENANQYNISDIRNRISHPNRPITENHWYKLLSVVTGSYMSELPMSGVIRAKEAAERGQIIPPPEEWVREENPVIPCILPEFVDHNITGLIGRNKEVQELKKLLSVGRASQIAIVARGGLGKTALALDVLHDCAVDSETQSWCDHIVYQTFKNEELTIDGTVENDHYECFKDLESTIARNLGSLLGDPDNTDLDLACDLFKDKRILLCIDNLETILRDAQDDCIEFLEKLPPLWKVLVTTRVPVDGFKSLRIKELNENSAMGMAARYLQSKGSDDYTKDDTKKIAEIAKCNPLAIRLTIDGFVRGNPLCDAAVTANTEVVKFSFDRLIGSLEADSIRFIETLYQAGKVGRTELPGLVGITLDRAIEIVRSLLNTSVISRDLSEEEEFYSLTSSMKEYVLHSEANIKIRRSVRNAINKREKRIRYVEQRQDNVSLNKNDYFFIPNDIPPGLKEPLYNAVKAIKTYNEHKFYRAASEALRNLKKFENTFNKNLTYRYYLGTLHRLLGDVDSALTHINYVVERDPTYFQARLLQAQLTSEFEDRDSIQSSEGLYKNLIEDVEEGVFGDITPSGSYHTNRGYYTCLYKLRKYDQLVQLSQNWEDSSDKLKQLRGSFYSIGLSMIMNGQHDDKIEKITGPLSEAAKQLKKTIRECGLSYDTIFAFSIIAKEGSHVFAFRREDIDDETSFEFLAELAGCLEYIDLNRESRSARELFQRIKRYLCNLRRVHTKYGNRIKQLYMPPSKINLTNKSRMEASGRGLLTVKIITVPRGNHRALFRFGRAHDGEEFFLSFNKLKSQSLSQWEDISVGDHVAIKPGHRPDLSKDREAEVIYLESDFETDSLN